MLSHSAGVSENPPVAGQRTRLRVTRDVTPVYLGEELLEPRPLRGFKPLVGRLTDGHPEEPRYRATVVPVHAKVELQSFLVMTFPSHGRRVNPARSHTGPMQMEGIHPDRNVGDGRDGRPVSERNVTQ